MLRLVREELGMDMAFIAEFEDGTRVFRHVDAAPRVEGRVVGGQPDVIGNTVCHQTLTGQVPQVVGDLSKLPWTSDEAWPAFRVGSHMGVALRHPDGRLYGTLCCLSMAANDEPGERELNRLKMAAKLLTSMLIKAELD